MGVWGCLLLRWLELCVVTSESPRVCSAMTKGDWDRGWVVGCVRDAECPWARGCCAGGWTVPPLHRYTLLPKGVLQITGLG